MKTKPVILLILALILCQSASSYVAAQELNIASRTSGAMPLGVFFDAVDTSVPDFTSGVVQPLGYTSPPANCTGVHISRINIAHLLGIGTLRYNGATSGLTWQAPSDTVGQAVVVSGGGCFTLKSGNQNAAIDIWVEPADLPADNATDSITIVSGGENADWHSFHYSWNFGDPDAGAWEKGAAKADGSPYSKNRSTGFLAGHVYEQPGSYTALLTIYDDMGNTHTYSQEILVTSDPPGGWSTYYFANDGNDLTGDGSIDNPFATVDKAMSLTGDGVRLLFKCGDTFMVNSGWVPAVDTFYVGAYGDGARPVINVTGAVSFVNGRNLSDARFVDLSIVNTLPINESRRDTYGILHFGDDALVLRTRIQDVGIGFNITPPTDTVVIQECETVGNTMGLWASSAPRAAVLGSSFTDARTVAGDIEALFRVYTDKLLLSSSYFTRPNQKKSIRFMSNTNGYGQWYIALNNRLDNVFGPHVQGNDDSIMVRNTLIAGNDYRFTEPGFTAVSLQGGDNVMIRNNRVFSTIPSSMVGIDTGYNEYDFHYSDIRILNNTIYSANTDYLRFLSVASGVTEKAKNLMVLNNVLHGPNTTDVINSFFIRLRGDLASTPLMTSNYNAFYFGSIAEPFVDSSGRLSLPEWQVAGKDNNSLIDNPLLEEPDACNFKLQTKSPCINRGLTTLYCIADADGNARPQAGRQDIGTYEFEYAHNPALHWLLLLD